MSKPHYVFKVLFSLYLLYSEKMQLFYTKIANERHESDNEKTDRIKLVNA